MTRTHLQQKKLSVPLLGAFALALSACGDEGSPAPVAPPTETFPAAEVAGTPETDALANAPARCGQDAFTWNRDLELGHITGFQTKGFYAKDFLQAAAVDALGDVPLTMKYDVRIHVITYVTQDRGVSVEATAMIAWPTDVPKETDALPALLVLHGTSGFTDGCSPSAETDQALLGAALASTGYIVVAPDYIGLKNGPPPTGFLHPYLNGQPTAMASLDAVRALGDLPADIREGDGRPSPKVAVVGGSQGGHAALWVDRLAPYYARELEIAGIATTVPPADLVVETELALTMVRPSTANVAAFYGANAGWYGKGNDLNQIFVAPLDKDLPAAMAAGCNPDGALAGKDTLEAIYAPALLASVGAGTFKDYAPWGCFAAENGLTSTTVPRIQKDAASYGILFVTGASDALVDTPTERASFETLCNAGMPMQYLECEGASHTKATTWALPEIVAFLGDRVTGKPFVKQCAAGAPVVCMATPPP